RRASKTASVADQLSLAARVARASGDARLADNLDQTRADLVRRGLTPNLDRARLYDPDNPHLIELTETVAQYETQPVTAPDNGPAKPKELEREFREVAREKGKREKGEKSEKSEKPSSERRELKGVIRSLDPVAGTVRVSVRDRERTLETTYSVPADARIRTGGR